MSTQTLVPPAAHRVPPPAVPVEAIYRLSVEQYHEMTRVGILTTEDRVELLEGWLVTKMTQSPLHRLVGELLREELERFLPSGWHINTQGPITLADSEPEPDLAVVRGSRRSYADRHPGPPDLGLVVEVSDSSLGRDRGSKKRVYARAGIQGYWIINLTVAAVEVYSNPATTSEGPDYQQNQVYTSKDEIPFVLEGKELGRLTLQQLVSPP